MATPAPSTVLDDAPLRGRRPFAVIFVLGAPGAGKGTLCNQLSAFYNLAHYSVGDALRAWMKANPDTALAKTIAGKLKNQGFLDPGDLNPFICQAIKDAMTYPSNDGRPPYKGILLDGFPRCEEQMKTFQEWPFESELPLYGKKPDLVLSFRVDKDKAKERYLARGRDANDSADKFERRFAEFEREGPAVESSYREMGVLVEIDANGTREENTQEMARKLLDSELWRSVVIDQSVGSSWFLVNE